MKSGKIVVAALAAVLSLTARAEAPFPLPKVPDVSIPDRKEKIVTVPEWDNGSAFTLCRSVP